MFGLNQDVERKFADWRSLLVTLIQMGMRILTEKLPVDADYEFMDVSSDKDLNEEIEDTENINFRGIASNSFWQRESSPFTGKGN